MKTPTANKAQQARNAARLTSDKPAASAMLSSYVGDVVGFQTTAHGLEYLRRVVARDLADDVSKLARARPKHGQPDAEFQEFYEAKEEKVAFLQDLLSAIGRAHVV